MRLTAELAQNSLSYLNPLKERELDLRGHRIPTVENLAAAGPQDALDLTDNDVATLGNFPLSPRLRTLLLARNRVRAIHPQLASSVPNLAHLVLTANNLAELADLDPLAGLPRLVHLSLVDNPVARKEHYRLWVIWRCPSVRFLDFQRVRDAEREHARQLFGDRDQPSALAAKVMGVKSKTFDLPTDMASLAAPKNYRVALTPGEKKSLEERIKNAKTLAEISRLEKELREGRISG